MREIKFRGKRLDNGDWEYGDLLQSGQKCYTPCKCSIIPGRAEASDPICKAISDYEVDPATLGQYWRTVNGYKLYDGDIIEISYQGETDIDKVIRLVAYSESKAAFCIIPPKHISVRWIDPEQVPNEDWWRLFGHNLRVIGNRFDNPELLKGEGDEK